MIIQLERLKAFNIYQCLPALQNGNKINYIVPMTVIMKIIVIHIDETNS